MRQVAVVSGKGGTGKTTLTALFAHLAARHRTVVIADADVEASNLPLALSATVTMSTTFSGLPRATLGPAECTGCGSCAQVCRFDAITRRSHGQYAIDAIACEGCGRCVAVCPHGAIQMRPSIAGASSVGVSSIGPIAFGQLEPGEDLSGKLVTEVRRLAVEEATRAGAEVLLIDGPPGVGCPLIASITNTDLLVGVAEPTLSGAHDLERLIDLANGFSIPVRVILNKADLSETGAQAVRSLCETRGIPLIAELPFDAGMARLLESLANDSARMPDVDSPTIAAAADAWRHIEADLRLTAMHTRETPPHRLRSTAGPRV